jgi:hypothetical protein
MSSALRGIFAAVDEFTAIMSYIFTEQVYGIHNALRAFHGLRDYRTANKSNCLEGDLQRSIRTGSDANFGVVEYFLIEAERVMNDEQCDIKSNQTFLTAMVSISAVVSA